MNKYELVRKVVSGIEGATIKDAEVIIDETFDVIKSTLVGDEKVAIQGFGTFDLTVKKEREGVIRFGAKKGETFTTPAKKSIKFKPSDNFKKSVEEIKIESGEE